MTNYFISVNGVTEYLTIDRDASQEHVRSFGTNDRSPATIKNEYEIGFGVPMPNALRETYCQGMALKKPAH
jgi:hypothetical protein